ncbi:hypothetical protein G7Y89_g8002 [Cudoniella acicularis]|uniref:Arylsulfotransferase n=1 Tax=Cudoniella acicularis TaxID=354080 RepID=A0A8H4RJF9_9HELO|nr:hypothetical protein G7Y89_g8002 [Cudoniella acicularis]
MKLSPSWGRWPRLGLLTFQLFVLASTCFPLVSCNWKYKSRPDLSPPTLNITIPASAETAPGYIFIAPYSGVPWSEATAHGPLQPGPYIFTSSGELIWSGFGYVSGWAANFQVARWEGKEVLFAFEGTRNGHGHSHGHVKILDERYETVKEVRGGNHELVDLHEFHVVDEKTALVESYHPLPYDLRPYGANEESQWIVDARFWELDIETGRVIFEWRSLDHVLPDESIQPISSLKLGTGHNSSDAIDYFHINSVDRDAQHNYLISGRQTSTIYKINGTTGEIIWRLGGKNSNFKLGSGVEFSFQHHARYISADEDTEVISLFDNSGALLPKGKTGTISSGKLLLLNTKTWTVTLLQAFPTPPNSNIFAFSQGNTQILPNGNAFTNWGSGGAITEHSANGTVLFHAFLESGELWKNGDVQNYRGFRYEWKGFPTEEIAVVALKDGESRKGTAIYGERVLLGEEERKAFETEFLVRGGKEWERFVVEAVGGEGEVLRKSKVVKSAEYVYPFAPGGGDFVERIKDLAGQQVLVGDSEEL